MPKEHKRGFVQFDGPESHGTVHHIGEEAERANGLTPKRFERVARLLQSDAVDFFAHQHVVVFGVGGVGSFAAESLARTGIGHLSLVDFDCVCETNINRQLPALQSTVGRFKVDVLVERFAQINPSATFTGHRTLFHAPTADELLESVDFVVDAIDNVTAKTYLIATCLERGIPIVSSMGAGGKLDPTRIQIKDISLTHGCRLARSIRRILRKEYGLDTENEIGVPAVFSNEYQQGPFPQPGDDLLPMPQGTLSCVTGAFGLAAASVVIRELMLKKEAGSP